GALLAHLATAAAFRRRRDVMIARLERTSVAKTPTPPVPAIVQSFAYRAVSESPVPKHRPPAPMRRDARPVWRSLAAAHRRSSDQVHEPGFVWRAWIQMAPLVYAHILDSYLAGEGLYEVRLFSSLRIARAAGPQISRG